MRFLRWDAYGISFHSIDGQGPPPGHIKRDRSVGIALGILHDVRIGAVNILEKVHKIISFHAVDRQLPLPGI